MLERAVLARVRTGLGLSHYLTLQQMHGTGGFTETFDASRLSPHNLRSIFEEEAERLGLAYPEAAGQSPGALEQVGRASPRLIHPAVVGNRTSDNDGRSKRHADGH